MKINILNNIPLDMESIQESDRMWLCNNFRISNGVLMEQSSAVIISQVSVWLTYILKESTDQADIRWEHYKEGTLDHSLDIWTV